MLHLASGLARPLATPSGAYLFDTGGYLCVFSSSLLGILIGAVFLVIRIRSYKWSPSQQAVRYIQYKLK